MTWMRQRCRFITNYSFLHIVRNIFIIFFWKSLITSVLCSSCSLRSMDAIQSSASIASKGVDFIATNINIPFWAASWNLRYFGCVWYIPKLCFNTLTWNGWKIHRFEQPDLVACLEIVLVYYMLSYLLRETPFMGSGIGGGLGFFFDHRTTFKWFL